MKKIEIYLDTSIIGGLFDNEFKQQTESLIEKIKNEKITGVISEITIRELENAPENVRKSFESYKNKLLVIQITDEIEQLAEEYIKEKGITEKFYEDALHIASATVLQVDVLVSWNFKHIVNFNRILKFNAVNLKNGYHTLQIYSPLEVINEE